jgi:hypothetical protein
MLPYITDPCADGGFGCWSSHSCKLVHPIVSQLIFQPDEVHFGHQYIAVQQAAFDHSVP